MYKYISYGPRTLPYTSRSRNCAMPSLSSSHTKSAPRPVRNSCSLFVHILLKRQTSRKKMSSLANRVCVSQPTSVQPEHTPNRGFGPPCSRIQRRSLAKRILRDFCPRSKPRAAQTSHSRLWKRNMDMGRDEMLRSTNLWCGERVVIAYREEATWKRHLYLLPFKSCSDVRTSCTSYT